MFGPFIYTCDRSIEVYDKTKKHIETNEHTEKLKLLAWAYHSIGEVIPHTHESLFSGHFFPWEESWNELQISFNLCLFGLYKQAMVSLRSGLEVGLLSVYWNLNDDGHIIIRKWLNSQEETPRFSEIWKRLERHGNFRAFQQSYDIKSRLLSLGYLHDYTHTKGFKYSNRMRVIKSNFQTFEEDGFNIWFEGFREVIEVLAILHLIKYPLGVIKYDYDKKFGIDKPMFGGLDAFRIEQLEQIVGREAFEAIEDMAKDDGTVQNTLKWVSDLPDMDEAAVEEQIIEFDKWMIEQNGIDGWLEQEKALMGEAFDQSEIHKYRIEYLIKWAKENSFEKPIWERLKGLPKL